MSSSKSAIPICFGLYRSDNSYHPSEDQINSIVKAAKINALDLCRIKDFTSGNYKQLDDVVKDLIKLKVDCLMVWRLDCLAPAIRDFENVVKFIAELSRFHISLISVEDKIDSDDPATIMLPNLHNSWVELKRNRRIENARRSHLKAKENGNKTGPRRRRDDEKIRQLHGRGLSIRKIAKETNFSPSLIHQVLQKIGKESTNSTESATDLSLENVQG